MLSVFQADICVDVIREPLHSLNFYCILLYYCQVVCLKIVIIGRANVSMGKVRRTDSHALTHVCYSIVNQSIKRRAQ